MADVTIHWSHWAIIAGGDNIADQITAVPCFGCYMVGSLLSGAMPEICILRGVDAEDRSRVFFMFAAIHGEQAEATVIDVDARKRFCHMHVPSPIKMFEQGMNASKLAINTAKLEDVSCSEIDLYKRIFAASRSDKFHVVEPGDASTTPNPANFEEKYTHNN